MDVEHEDTDFEWNSRFDGKPLELPKSWDDVISWLQAFDESCSTVEDSGVWMNCGVM